MRLLKLLLVVFVCAAGPAVAGPYEDGNAAYQKGDHSTALRLWRPLAEQGDARAQFSLGFMYRNGQGVPQDDAAAMSWYRKAADQGHADAQYNLGIMYGFGRGVPQDNTAALSWFRKAADRGNPSAQYNLGVSYASGQGLPQDYVQAHKWFSLAASRFDASEKEKREKAVTNRDKAAAKMTPAQIAEAQKLAREWKPK